MIYQRRNAKKLHRTFLQPPWILSYKPCLLCILTTAYFSPCVISVFNAFSFLEWVLHERFIIILWNSCVFRWQHPVFFGFHCFSPELFLSKSVIPCPSWMSCDVNSTRWISCQGLWISRLATRWPSRFTRRGHSCCVFDCYPKSAGLCPSVTDWYLAWSPRSKRPLG